MNHRYSYTDVGHFVMYDYEVHKHGVERPGWWLFTMRVHRCCSLP